MGQLTCKSARIFVYRCHISRTTERFFKTSSWPFMTVVYSFDHNGCRNETRRLSSLLKDSFLAECLKLGRLTISRCPRFQIRRKGTRQIAPPWRQSNSDSRVTYLGKGKVGVDTRHHGNWAKHGFLLPCRSKERIWKNLMAWLDFGKDLSKLKKVGSFVPRLRKPVVKTGQ